MRYAEEKRGTVQPDILRCNVQTAWETGDMDILETMFNLVQPQSLQSACGEDTAKADEAKQRAHRLLQKVKLAVASAMPQPRQHMRPFDGSETLLGVADTADSEDQDAEALLSVDEAMAAMPWEVFGFDEHDRSVYDARVRERLGAAGRAKTYAAADCPY